MNSPLFLKLVVIPRAITFDNEMAKELIFGEESCQHLQLLESLNKDAVLEFAAISLQILDSGKTPSLKTLNKASAKLNVDADQLANCLKALALLFLEMTKQLKSSKRALTSLELLGIGHAETLTTFWTENVRMKISKIIISKRIQNLI